MKLSLNGKGRSQSDNTTPGACHGSCAKLLVIILVLWSIRLPAAVLYVDVKSPSPTAPYVAWATAAHTIQNAVDAARAGDIVEVADGVYATGQKISSDGSASRVAVDKTILVKSVNGPSLTTIKGWPVFDPFFIPQRATNGVRCVALTDHAVLSGFTLTNGAAPHGGGVWCESTTAVVSNCLITGNVPVGDENGVGAYGGTLYDCTIERNSGYDAMYGIRGGGGAKGSILYDCILRDNSAGYGAGATESTLYNCLVTSNYALRHAGGGVANCTLYHCYLLGNSVRRGIGGGAFESTLYNCTVDGNTALGDTGNGGGVFDCVLYNSHIVNNVAVHGGGANSGTLYNCTVTGNSALGSGGVSYANLYNTITYYNHGSRDPNYDSTSVLNYCCTTPLPANGVGNIDEEPGFVNLATGDHHLLFGSPCINAGTNLDWMIETTDLDGNPRLSGSAIDIGAYEFQLSSGGLITGQGWLNSPGTLNPGRAKSASVSGKAMFSFAARCSAVKNVPIGAVQFTMNPARLRFTSTRCSMLAVAGDRAQLKGQGTINGQGNFTFTLTALEQKMGRGHSDLLRVKICDDATGAVVYDNQAGTPDNATLGNATIIRGNIMVRNR